MITTTATITTTTKKNKFNVREKTYKEEIILELTKVFNEDMNTTNNIINNFAILVTSKNKQIGQKRNMSKEIIDSILINWLQSYNKYETLHPAEISIKSNTVVADLNRYKNYKYRFLMNSLFFSASVTNNANVIFISCNGLDDAKESLIDCKLYKTISVINLYQFHN